jgi:hypothetical protein
LGITKRLQKRRTKNLIFTLKSNNGTQYRKWAGVATKVVRKIKMQKWNRCAKSFGKHLTRTQVTGYKIFNKLKWK